MMRKATVGDRKRYEVLSQMLSDRAAEIKNKLRLLREVLPTESAQVKDAEEQSMEDFVLGMDFALMEMESETLKKIDEALRRLRRVRPEDRRAAAEGAPFRQHVPRVPGASRGGRGVRAPASAQRLRRGARPRAARPPSRARLTILRHDWTV